MEKPKVSDENLDSIEVKGDFGRDISEVSIPKYKKLEILAGGEKLNFRLRT
jgi:hypothetical protein